MNEFDFGVFSPFIQEPLITDINYNGKHCWIDHLRKGRYCVPEFDFYQECEQIAFKFANYANLPFNAVNPIVEAETNHLRISLVHASISGKLSISIRKTPATMRLTPSLLKKQPIAPEWVLKQLAEFVQIKSNIIISGLPGSGKTELVKYLSQYIEHNQRVITIEDTYELRYSELHPLADCVAMKVNERFDYTQAIKACLRQRPDWIVVSEVRSHEVVNLLQSVSTGASMLSTIHAASAQMIPRRIMHMFPGVELSNDNLHQMICDTIDIGVHVEAVISRKGIKRYIREVVYFDIVDNQPQMGSIYQVGQLDNMMKDWPAKLNEKKRLYEFRKGVRSQ